MCGFIVVFKKKNSKDFSKKKLFLSSSYLSHRGPDDNHHYIDNHVMMDFYRLNILDLSRNGRQPMESFSGRYVIVFNGEIYNKDNLKKKINFNKLRGSSDTEVLVNLFEKYKFKMMDFLEGMFSFVIYDKKLKKIFVGRDRFGMKPLYYLENNDYFIFSSEIKPIIKFSGRKKIDEKSAYNFFFNQRMDYDGTSFFKDIKSLPPASVALVDETNFKIKKYWQIVRKNIILSQKDVEEKLKLLLDNSIKQHLLSDVNVGLFLSGGTDSTILAKNLSDISTKFKTYTYDFLGSGKYGETNKAKKTAKLLNLKNTNVMIGPDYIIQNFNRIIETLESPFTSIRLFGDFKLYDQCKLDKTKVVLLGQGGDEIFSGYKYNNFAHYYDLEKNKSTKFNILDQVNMTKDGLNYLFAENFNHDFRKKYSNLFRKGFDLGANNYLKNSQLIDINYINLPRSLKYSDRLSMKHGIEARIPYLNHKLAEFGFNLDSKFKYKKNMTRAVLKNYVKKNKIYRYLTINKKAVADPQRNWFKKELKDFFMDKINSTQFINSDIFNYNKVKNNYENLVKGKINTSFNLFQIISYHEFEKNF